MKTIILAAGQGKRLRPITNNIPKPMVKILGKPILEYILEAIKEFSNDVIIVTKYKEEKIKEYFGNKFKNINILYKTQGEEKGTAAALFGLDLNEDFILLNGDTIYDKKDLEKLYNLTGYGCLVKEVSQPEKYGIFHQNPDGTAKQIIEKPQNYIGNLANVGVYKFPAKLLKLIKNTKLSPRGEYELPDAINELLKDTKFHLINQKGDFIDIGYPQDIQKAEKILLGK